ncbi:MAG: metallophosphoesterase [Cyclobacteriaceae bacterium]
MIRILHLSDFHLNKHTKKDWELYLSDALLDKLEELNNESPINIIAFTGDMVDKGGTDFGGVSKGLPVFIDSVARPILTKLNLPETSFFMVPGNHDIERSKDSKRDELGSRSYFDSLDTIRKYAEDESEGFSGMKRIQAYKEYEANFYANHSKGLVTNFGCSFINLVNDKTIGIVCLNSSWRCYDNDDHGRLIIGQDDVTKHVKNIKDANIKIALVHHPLDSLSDVEKKVIQAHISKEFDVLLFGHSHETYTSISSGFTGRIFYNMAPSGLNNIYSNDRDYSNGFSIIDIDDSQVCAYYWRYNHKYKNFVVNTDAGHEGTGKLCESIPSKNIIESHDQIKELLDNIKDTHYPKMDELVIGMKADIKEVNSVKDAFIMPPIDDGKQLSKDEDPKNTSLNEILKSGTNRMFFGSNEAGKTILLYRLVIGFVESFDLIGKIPVYINFDDIGNQNIKTAIKDYLACKTETVDKLLSTNQIVLLVDNLNYQKFEVKGDHLKRLHNFFDENENIQIIATADDGYMGTAPLEYFNYCKIPFKTYFIKNLRAREIRSLVKQWVPSDDPIKEEERIDKMITDFHSYSLPSTVMSVSLFLWSSEYSSTKPVNHAVLLENYIEIILQKLSPQNIYRDTFDFKNKSQLLASIAQGMLDFGDDDNYSLSYSDYVKEIENYLKKVGFDYDSELIARYFIDRKIFTKYQGNKIKFSYSCFFHFFLAKRMEYNEEFYALVISEKEYFKFIKEIDYYTGLTRSDKKLVETIFKRFKEVFSETDYIIPQMEGKWDTHFILSEDKESKDFEPKSKDITIGEIKENRPSEQLLEDFYNRRLSQIQNPGRILKKNGRLTLETLLILMCNVLRNSEGVEDKKLKSDVYENIIKYSLTWALWYRETLIQYVIDNQRLPPNIPIEVSLRNALTNMPLHIQLGMSRHLGTYKLAPIIKEKIHLDFQGDSITKSDLEAFFSVALYADIQGKDFPEYFKKFIKKSKNTPVRDYAFYKLLDYFFRRTKEGSPNEDIYLEMLATLRNKSKKLTKRFKESFEKVFRERKKEYLKLK